MERHWWHLARNRIISLEIKKLLNDDSGLLEIGCGRGIVVKGLRERSIDCVGIEPAETKPLPDSGQHVRTGTKPEDLPISERLRYKVIALFDVIEHVPEPVSFLKGLKDLFPSLEYVVITVPARMELWSNYDEFYGHHRRYNFVMINDLSVELNWKILTNKYFFHSIYVAIFLVKFLVRERSVEIKSPSNSMSFMHRVFSILQVLDYYLLPKNVPGTSIISVFSVADAAPAPRR